MPVSLRPALHGPDGALRQRKDEPPQRPGTEGATEERVWWRLRRRQPYVQVLQTTDGLRVPGAYGEVQQQVLDTLSGWYATTRRAPSACGNGAPYMPR